MTEPRQSEYDRGHDAGGIDERLKGVEAHLVRNNGSIAEQVKQTAQMIEKIQALTVAIDRLGDHRVQTDTALGRVSRTALVLAAMALVALTVAVVLIVTQ
jgi:hypothetical protein